MNELEFIARLTENLPSNRFVLTGPGDDCAVVENGSPGQLLLLKTDAVVEGVHFDQNTVPEAIGHKALARCLSDIAAMAGRPLHALVTIGFPSNCQFEFIQRIYAGLNTLAAKHDVAVVGGETTASPDRIFISIALLGSVAKGKCPLRSGAKAGDAIFVTGQLGGSIAGKHLDFQPRLAEGRWLAENFPISSMIDLSDGLATDLRRILHASRAGAELLAASIPVSRAAKLRFRTGESKKAPLTAALTDGEDFELLFTVPSSQAVQLLDGWKQQFPELPLSCIGRITSQPGLLLRSSKGLQPVTEHGYIHFA
jgi:thiamine-monophosphate kinase